MKQLQLVILATAFAASHAAFAQPDATCSGSMVPGTYHNVTAQAGCQINPGVVITGNLAVIPGGSLYTKGVIVYGNLRATGAVRILIYQAQIGNNLEISGLTGFLVGGLTNVIVQGNLQFQDSLAGLPFGIGTIPPLMCNSGCDSPTPGYVIVHGNLQVRNNARPVDVVGAPQPAVFGSTVFPPPTALVGGDIQMENNSGAVSLDSFSAYGNIQAHDNSGGATLKNNSAGGDCQASGATGSGNTAVKTNTCPI